MMLHINHYTIGKNFIMKKIKSGVAAMILALVYIKLCMNEEGGCSDSTSI